MAEQSSFHDLLGHVHTHLSIATDKLGKMAVQYDCGAAASNEALQRENESLAEEIRLLRKPAPALFEHSPRVRLPLPPSSNELPEMGSDDENERPLQFTSSTKPQKTMSWSPSLDSVDDAKQRTSTQSANMSHLVSDESLNEMSHNKPRESGQSWFGGDARKSKQTTGSEGKPNFLDVLKVRKKYGSRDSHSSKQTRDTNSTESAALVLPPVLPPAPVRTVGVAAAPAHLHSTTEQIPAAVVKSSWDRGSTSSTRTEADGVMGQTNSMETRSGFEYEERTSLEEGSLWPIWSRSGACLNRVSSYSLFAQGGAAAGHAGNMRIAAISVRLMEMAMASNTVRCGGSSGGSRVSRNSLHSEVTLLADGRWSRGLSCFNAFFLCFMIHPQNMGLLVWQTLGAIVIIYDCLVLPLQVFEMPQLLFWDVMAWIVTFYWSLDMILQFFLGKETESKIEMLPSRAMCIYLQQWFIIDAVIVSFDWVSIFLYGGKTSSKGTKAFRLFRSLRTLRVIRLVRVVKGLRTLRRFMDRIQSEVAMVIMKLSLMMLATATIAHYMAASWYFIGTKSMEMGQAESWTTNFESAGGSQKAEDLYIISLHWALSQSGYAPIDIFSCNFLEHCFASLVSFLWLLIHGFIIAGLSRWMIQLREANRHRVAEESKLRRYLVSHHITIKHTEDVLKYFRKQYTTHTRSVHEEDIMIFRDLPVHLRVNLHRQVYMPILKLHPLFNSYSRMNEAGLLSVCHLAMVETFFPAGAEVFTEGQIAEFMFYTTSGKFEYYNPTSKEFDEVEAGTWVNEPVLWRTWKQRGILTAFVSSETVGLEAAKFHAIMEEVEDSGFSIQFLRNYAKGAVEFFGEHDPGTDIWGDAKQLSLLVPSLLRSSSLQVDRAFTEKDIL